MNIKNRIKKLEKQDSNGFYIVMGDDEKNKEQEIQNHCDENNIDRSSSIVIYMSSQDAVCL